MTEISLKYNDVHEFSKILDFHYSIDLNKDLLKISNNNEKC